MASNSHYYTRTAQFLHWIMAIIFISAWIIGFYSGNFLSFEHNEALKSDAIDLHKNIATTLIFLIVIRIGSVTDQWLFIQLERWTSCTCTVFI